MSRRGRKGFAIILAWVFILTQVLGAVSTAPAAAEGGLGVEFVDGDPDHVYYQGDELQFKIVGLVEGLVPLPRARFGALTEQGFTVTGAVFSDWVEGAAQAGGSYLFSVTVDNGNDNNKQPLAVELSGVPGEPLALPLQDAGGNKAYVNTTPPAEPGGDPGPGPDGGTKLEVDAGEYHGLGATATLAVYDDSLDGSTTSLVVDLFTVQPGQGFNPADPGTYEIVSSSTATLTGSMPGPYSGTVEFVSGAPGAGEAQVNENSMTTLVFHYRGGPASEDFYRMVTWVPGPMVTALDFMGQPTDTLLGLGGATIAGKYFPMDAPDSISLLGVTDPGTPADPGDDIAFDLSLDLDESKNWPGKSWKDYTVAAQLFSGQPAPAGSIPVIPTAANDITLTYTNGDNVVEASVTWTPPTLQVDAPEGGYTGLEAQPRIDLLNTGLENGPVLVKGTSNAGQNSPVEFQIVIGNMTPPAEGEPHTGDFWADAHLVQAQGWTQRDLNDFPMEIPVNPLLDNTVTLSYRTEGGTELAGTSFVWHPGEGGQGPGGGGVWGSANLHNQPGFQSLVTETPSVDVEVWNFLGNQANLSLELMYVSEGGQTTTVALLTGVEDVTATVLGDQADQNQRLFRFTAAEGDTNNLSDAGFNDRDLTVKLRYQDVQNPDLDRTDNLGNVRADNLAPGEDADPLDDQDPIGVSFDSIVEAGEHAGKYRFRIYLDDQFSIDTAVSGLVSANFLLMRDGVEVEDAGKAVEPLRNLGEPEDSPYRQVFLYLTAPQSGDVIRIQNLTDWAGHAMASAADRRLYLGAQVEGTLTDALGGPVPGADILLVRYDEATGLDFTQKRLLRTDENGTFKDQLEAGTFRTLIVRLSSIPKEEGNGIYLDEPVTIPPGAPGEAYQLNLQLPGTNNVTGRVTLAEGESGPYKLVFARTAYLDAAEEVDEEFYSMATAGTETDVDGNFSLYLPAGEFKFLGRQEGFSILPPVSEVVFTVGESGADLSGTTIAFPESNVFGTIVGSLQQPAAYATFMVVGAGADNADFEQFGSTDEQGGFGLALTDGQYRLMGVMVMPAGPGGTEPGGGDEPQGVASGLYLVDVAITVSDGLATAVSGDHGTLGADGSVEVFLPAINVTIQLTRGGEVLNEGGRLVLTLTDGEEEEEFDLFGQGIYNYHLLPGTYRLTEAELFGMGYQKITLDEEIIVDANTNLAGDNALQVDVQGSSNVVISFVDDDGNPTGANYGLGLEKKGNFEFYWSRADSNGRIYLQLTPGIYRINGYESVSDDNTTRTWNELRASFEVTEAHTPDSPLLYAITVREPNVVGVVLDDDDKPIPWAWINVKRLPGEGELFATYLGFPAGGNGAFSTTLDDGSYVVEGVGTPNSWMELGLKFYVINGEVHLEEDGSDAVQNPFTIQKPAPNVTGHVYKTYDQATGAHTLYVGFTDQPDYQPGMPTGVRLGIRPAGISEEQFREAPWLYERWTDVEADGSFAISLDAGETYVAFAVGTPRRWVELNPGIQFTVPAADVVVVPPTPNFSGVVTDFDGNPMGPGWLGIEKADFSGWIGTPVDEDGRFGVGLTPGTTYIVRELGYEIEGEGGQRQHGRVVYNRRITVPAAGSLAVDLRPNVRGSIALGDLEVEPGEALGLIVRQVLAESDPNYVDSTQNPWKYENWFELSYDSGTATFTGYLEDGEPGLGKEYRLVAVAGPRSWTEIGENFTLSRESAVDGSVAYDQATESYQLDFSFVPNVVGQVLDGNNPVADAWINIESETEDAGDDKGTGAQKVQQFGSRTNSGGQFGLKLADGRYRVTGYGTPGRWVGTSWQPGKWVSVGYRFQVIGGSLADQNGDPLAGGIQISSNVGGVVQRFYRTGDENRSEVIVTTPGEGQLVTLKRAWVNIWPVEEDGSVDRSDWSRAVWTDTGETGSFSLMLAPGDYRVTEVGARDFWMQADISFTVDAEGKLAPGANVVDGRLAISPQAPNVKGTVYKEDGGVLSHGWLAIKPRAAGPNDWQEVRWINTDADGKFAARLGDGQWKVSEVNAPGSWYRASLPFTVTGDQLTSPLASALENGELQVRPAQGNVTGVVFDSDDQELGENAWITIKPASAGRHDWSNATRAEYRQFGDSREFRLFLEAGQYRVVEVVNPNFYYEPDVLFSVDDNGTISGDTVAGGRLKVRPAEPNTSGTVYRPDDPTTPMGYAWVDFIRIDAAGQQLTMDGDALPEGGAVTGEIRWEHARGVGADQNGNFSLRLSPGTYKIVGVSGEGGWYRPDTTFSVTAEDGAPDLVVQAPGDNVTIAVTGTGLEANDAWIDVQEAGQADGPKRFIPIRLQARQNGDYVFAAYLADGNYRIVGFGTPDGWSEVNQDFTVTGITAISVDFAAKATRRVSGNVLSSGTGVAERAWVAILPVVGGAVDTTTEKRWVQTLAGGGFSFELAEGETWAITDVTTSSGYYTTDDGATPGDEALNFAWTVSADEVQTPEAWFSGLDTDELSLSQ